MGRIGVEKLLLLNVYSSRKSCSLWCTFSILTWVTCLKNSSHLALMVADPSSHTLTAYNAISNTTNALVTPHPHPPHHYDSIFIILHNLGPCFVYVMCPHLIFLQLCANIKIRCAVLYCQFLLPILYLEKSCMFIRM
jgi:hypothetical protein